MKKILIVSYYDLKDFFINIKDGFENYGYTVVSYPLFRYAYDANDKISDYKEHMGEYIRSVVCPDIILWWFIDVAPDVFKYIKKMFPNIYYILYNFDDPLNICQDLFEKCKIFNLVITCCKENMFKYKIHSGVKNVMFHPFCYDPTVFYANDAVEDSDSEDSEYICDISINCHNLYSDESYFKNQYIKRTELIDNLIKYSKNKDRVFKIFGHPVIKQLYPDNYCGEIPYYKLNRLYNLSKINLTTHPYCNKSLSINDNVFQILGSGGLLLVDPIKDLDKLLVDGEHVVYLKKNNYIEQIDEILNNYDRYKSIRNGGHTVSAGFVWSEWCKKIHIEINKAYFDPILYKNLYDINIDAADTSALFENWLNNPNRICHSFEVPNNFKHEEYALNKNIKIPDGDYARHKLYVDWYKNSDRNTIYLANTRNDVNFDPSKNNISMECFFVLCNTLNKIRKYGTDKDNGLIELGLLVDKYHYVDINAVVNKYFNLCY